MQIQISWLLQKPTDLDLHCLQRQDISGFSRTRVKGEVSREWNYFKPPSSFLQTVTRLCCSSSSLFVRPWFHVAFILSVFVPYLTFFCCPGEAVLRDCGIISWVALLIFNQCPNNIVCLLLAYCMKKSTNILQYCSYFYPENKLRYFL